MIEKVATEGKLRIRACCRARPVFDDLKPPIKTCLLLGGL